MFLGNKIMYIKQGCRNIGLIFGLVIYISIYFIMFFKHVTESDSGLPDFVPGALGLGSGDIPDSAIRAPTYEATMPPWMAPWPPADDEKHLGFRTKWITNDGDKDKRELRVSLSGLSSVFKWWHILQNTETIFKNSIENVVKNPLKWIL